LNVILVLVDSLNRHHLRAYDPESPVETPNIDAFARRAHRFENHFVGSLPCMPARREIFSGFKEMLWRPWGPLEPFDARLPEMLEREGYATAIVTDHYHYWEEAANGYIQSFQSAELVRGHENDFWKTPVTESEPVPAWVERIEEWRPGKGRGYYANVRSFRGEEDYFPAKVFSGAARWLSENARKKPFFLQVESFDVHEPFDVPEPYASMYGDASGRDRFTVWPPYQNVEELAEYMSRAEPEELDFVRSQYFGKLSMVDRWFGELTCKLDELDLWEETAVILTTDHGHDLGERGAFGKQYPHYDSHANIPLLVRHPDHTGNGESVPALTQTVDLHATVLEMASSTAASHPHSRSMLPILRGEESRREALLYGTFGQGACVTDGEWILFKSPENDDLLRYYSAMIFGSLVSDSIAAAEDSGYFIPGVSLPQWKVPVRDRPRSRENFLFNRVRDPGQTENLWETEPAERERMLGLLRELIAEEGAPAEQSERLGLT
jgi:arylsulfatase A-like enzyme